jgi:putative SOS response-associated peptidase YedK
LFRHAFQQRRCPIPADGFYEWLARGGIWETWHVGEKDALTSAAIITTPANASIRVLHDRMPVILEPGDWEAWLLGNNPAELLRPAAETVVTWHAVDPAVGKIRHDDLHLIEPIAER